MKDVWQGLKGIFVKLQLANNIYLKLRKLYTNKKDSKKK